MRNRVILAVLGASGAWGLAGVGVRAAYGEGATTLPLLTFRSMTAVAALILVTITWRTQPPRQAWVDGSLIGIFRVGLSPMLFMACLNYVSAGVEGLIVTLIPATTAILAALIIREHVSPRQVAGLVIGLVGTTLIAVSGDSGLGADGNATVGFLFGLGGVSAAAFSGVLQRKYAPRHDTVHLALPMFASGLAVAIVVGLAVGYGGVGGYSGRLWLLIVALGLGATLLPFALTLYASKHATATMVSITAYLAPLVAVVMGAALLDERITPMIVSGAALAMVGVGLVGKKRSPIPAPAA